jgi:D-glycero-D-manno-heptose 1,7-bisphosphate phosphatase
VPLPQAVLLDRDGTVNVQIEGDYVRTPDQLRLLPGAGAAVAALNAAGVMTLLVTNQRGVSLGVMTEADLDAVHARLADLLAEQGAALDGIYACPHASDACDCRKPLAGLAQRAAADHGLDLSRCLVIGDSSRDVGLARAVGARVIRIGPDPDPLADLTVTDLTAAVDRALTGI